MPLLPLAGRTAPLVFSASVAVAPVASIRPSTSPTHPCPLCAPAGTAYAASQGGHLFKLEDIAVGSWLEWAAQRRGLRLHLAADRRFNYGGCRAGDLVSHYIRPAQQLCMWAQEGRCRGC
jgi:hypothetical protein